MSVADPDSWKTKRFRNSVVDKLENELSGYALRPDNGADKIENQIFEKSTSKVEYLGYSAKLILALRNMVCVDDMWLKTMMLSKPPPRLRKILSPEELAEYAKELMNIGTKMQENNKIQPKRYSESQ